MTDLPLDRYEPPLRLRRASALVEALKARGEEPESKHYSPGHGDDLDRWYVVIDKGEIQYSVQYNDRIIDGTVQSSKHGGTKNEPDPLMLTLLDTLRQRVNREVT